jgi:hypothetical protein
MTGPPPGSRRAGVRRRLRGAVRQALLSAGSPLASLSLLRARATRSGRFVGVQYVECCRVASYVDDDGFCYVHVCLSKRAPSLTTSSREHPTRTPDSAILPPSRIEDSDSRLLLRRARPRGRGRRRRPRRRRMPRLSGARVLVAPRLRGSA